MTERLLALLVAALVMIAFPLAASAEGYRVYSNAHRPYRLLAKQYATGANVFPTTDPSPAGTPLALSNAMGLSPTDGVVSLQLGAGFTPPVTLTAYYWQADKNGTGQAGYVRAGAASASYAQAADSNYTLVTFSGLPGDTPFVILSSAAVTGNVYCSAPASSYNPGSSATGY